MTTKNFLVKGTLLFLAVFPILLCAKDPQYIDLANTVTTSALLAFTQIGQFPPNEDKRKNNDKQDDE